jgi:hypothetical protein
MHHGRGGHGREAQRAAEQRAPARGKARFALRARGRRRLRRGRRASGHQLPRGTQQRPLAARRGQRGTVRGVGLAPAPHRRAVGLRHATGRDLAHPGDRLALDGVGRFARGHRSGMCHVRQGFTH